MICVIQVDDSQIQNEDAAIKLPDYLDVEKEITDLPEFQPMSLARLRLLSQMKSDNPEEEKGPSSADEEKV